MTNKVIIIDYCKFKDITGISDENFKKRTKKEKNKMFRIKRLYCKRNRWYWH